MAQRRRNRLSPEQRGYDRSHKLARRAWVPKVATGTVPCRRCGKLIAAGAPWDLGHDDYDRSLPSAPEHRDCNRATNEHGRRGPSKRSRAW